MWCVYCLLHACLDLNKCNALNNEIHRHRSTDKTLFFIGILVQAVVAINIGHGKEETDRASSSLRGFKKLDQDIEKLYWQTHAHSGYQHWNNGQGNGRDRNGNGATPDYSLTEKELIDTAIASKQAATSAYELAGAAAKEDYDAIKEAVGKLNAAAYLAKAEAELACALLPTESEEDNDENKPDVDNLLQNVSHIEAIANTIAEEATKTADAAELAVTALHAPTLKRELVSVAVFYTKSQADRVASMVELLIMLMVGNAGPNGN